MDYIRTCYRVQMRLRVGDDPVTVQWFRAPPGALAMPIMGPFGSRNWESRGPSPDGMGEQPGPRQWVNGETISNAEGLLGDALAVQCAASHADWWSAGLGVGEHSGPYDAQARPTCCLRVPESDCGDDPCPCADLTDPIEPDAVQWGGVCPFIAGPTLTKTGACEWSTSWATWSGTFDTRIRNVAGVWTWEVDTSPPVSYSVSGDTCPPVVIDFPIPGALDAQPWCLGVPCPGSDVTLRFQIP